ncbi:glycosyltransferase family 25 protein [Alteromonas sp. McT4-15]|uniref:glycosyltransferase family 25 protein n=1 Tax=Alteromonas sp. McT4-15 TaxID=2881256 RepID=UPI001CF89F49|nr:glycosyltransferase family 25 protein [Alteromonas sp. McT4-15]MCB4435514.1 glycosyltransferase family 25 protein [Alteromonas sp. McT4-15]MEC8232511.1 glycosyltransferase family 25 protein [Pseudomonadota bacterium]
MFPIFVINLATSPERWESASSRLKALNLKAERFDAVLGKALTSEEVESFYDAEANRKYHHRNLTAGEIGCYISHRNVWQKMIDENIARCLILEDDLTIDDKLIEVLSHIEGLSKWDMIKIFDNRDVPFQEEIKLDDTYTLGNFTKVPNCALGYALSLEGAKKLLKRKNFFRAVDVDIQIHSEVGISIFGIKPYRISQNTCFDSDIEAVNEGRHSNRSTFFRNLKFRIKMYLERKKISGDISKVVSNSDELDEHF